MGACFEDKSMIISRKIITENKNLVEQRANNDKNESLEATKSFVNININLNKIENTNDIKYLSKDNENNSNKTKSKEKSSIYICKNVNLKYLVKSQYIIKEIFLHLNEREKLLLIRYNNFYNKLLDINIECYKNISDKIKIGERNGYGKEYDKYSMNLIFKGYYKNGKKNGEGKEYSYKSLLFEGEYLNGKRNGKGIEYNFLGNIIFEGEYLNGNKWKGKIKEFYDYDKLKFDGEYLEGKRKGKEYDEDGNVKFEGEYLYDKRWNGIIYNKYNNSS